MPLDSDIDAILDLLIASFSGALRVDLEGELVSIYVAGDAQMVSWAGLEFEGPPTKAAVSFAKTRSATLIKDLDAATRERLRTTIANGIANKRGVPGLARDIRATFTDMSRYRSELIAQTETSNALGEAFMDRSKKLGITGKEWITAGDERVSLECQDNEMAGAIPLDQAFPAGPMRPPQHPGCLLPKVEVEVPHLVAGSRAWYEGDTIELRTASGKHLSVTPNHMVLTTSGFVKAECLREGDYVVSSQDGQGIMKTVHPDYHHSPTAIAKVWHALLMEPDMVRSVVPVAAEDFHGDAGRFNGHVDVVYPDGFLPGKVRDALVGQHSHQGALHHHRPSALPFPRASAELLFGQGLDSTRRGDMRSSRAGLALAGSHLSHGDDVGLGTITRDYPSVEQAPPDAIPADADGPTQRQFGLPRQIAGDQIDGGYSAARIGTESVLFEEPVEGRPAYVELGDQFLERFAGMVTLDKITEVWNRYFRGHVYDLQSLESLYIANGVIVKNCRCAAAPVML